MAMNKKEQAAFADLERQLALVMALRVTDAVEYDVMPPSVDALSTEKLRKGWLFNSYNDEVGRACTSSMYHNRHGDDKTTTQQPARLYSTEERALRALRHAVELICMKRLAGIDNRIKQAKKASPQ